MMQWDRLTLGRMAKEREEKKKQFEAECTMEDNFYEDELEERE